ncbi:hypothetical protein FB451DRAFT_129101 [Mycena latifolia]|nr:hypothetical protein FB451DRAFT_129101 [Mycena latifolia]
MKRASPSTGDGSAPKRTKASQACALCRRQKYRCEILDARTQPGAGAVTIRCHRCKTLGVECSFETSDLTHFVPKPTTRSPAVLAVASETPTSSPPEIYGSLNTLASVASSRSNSETFPVNSTPNSTPGGSGLLPEDLVPTATTPIWGCINRVDWTATPMLAMQELVRCPRTDSGLQIVDARNLADILSPPEIRSLLEIFETRYSPWLCAQPGSLECTNSLLDIVRCTIASRHLAPGVRSVIAPRLHKLTEEVFFREVFNPQPSLESIKALLILSVWTPLCGTGAEARDGRLLIASAVSMAMNLHLQNESKRATGLQAEEGGLGPDKQAELDECTQRWRLWMYLSLSESMLCIGTGREPVSHLSQLDLKMATSPTLPAFTLSAVRDIRLGLSVKLFHMAETALNVRLKRADDMCNFFHETNASLDSIEVVCRLLTPLPVITQHDTFYSHMLILQYHACRLLIMHHALREMRTIHEKERPLAPWYFVRAEGQTVALYWGATALASAEAVLTAFLAPSDLTLLSTAPDNLYVMVGFAATWLFVSNYTFHQMCKKMMGGASEQLPAMAIERLNQIAHAPDHAASRCGHVLGALLAAWELRKSLHDGVRRTVYDMTWPPSTPSVYQQRRESESKTSTETVNTPDTPDYQDSENAYSDLFMDDAFWASFIENLNSDTFVGQNAPVM